MKNHNIIYNARNGGSNIREIHGLWALLYGYTILIQTSLIMKFQITFILNLLIIYNAFWNNT